MEACWDSYGFFFSSGVNHLLHSSKLHTRFDWAFLKGVVYEGGSALALGFLLRRVCKFDVKAKDTDKKRGKEIIHDRTSVLVRKCNARA